jgi:hypothetical protein
LETVVDGYDQLISEAEVDELRQGPTAHGRKRIAPDQRIPDRMAPVIERSLPAAEYAQDAAMSLSRATTGGPLVAVVPGASAAVLLFGRSRRWL